MSKRALSFGAVAAAYERFRPGYPDEVVDAVLAYASSEVRTALEIGAGTGKATRAFADRGIAVTATDPDDEMLAELRRNVPASVRTVPAAFEDLSLGPDYDLVFAAASLHWTRPDGRWDRIAALLRPQGVFACFGGQMHLADDDLEARVTAARAPYLADDGVPSPDGTPSDSETQWPGTELLQTDLFTDVLQRTIERRTTVNADDYLGHLSTISAYLQLPEPDRAAVFEQIRAVLPGHVTVASDITVHLARLS